MQNFTFTNEIPTEFDYGCALTILSDMNNYNNLPLIAICNHIVDTYEELNIFII